MDNSDFDIFVDRIYPVITEKDSSKPEISNLVSQLQMCIKAYRYYNREYKAKTL